MKKEYRIRKNEEFAEIISKRHKAFNECYTFYFDYKKEDHSRVGISVSKKLGNAVVRNKTKRQVRMLVHDLIDLETFEFDLIIVVKNSYLEHNYEYNGLQLKNALNKCKIK